MPPAATALTPSVLAIARSATGFTVSVSVALLLPGVGSVVPPGAVTVAVLEMLPIAATVAGTVYVMTAPFFIVTVVLRLPDPLAAPHAVVTVPPLPGLLTAHVQLPIASPTGAVSTTVAPATSLGPLFVTVIVYVVLPPANTAATPSVLVIARSATGFTVSVSVALSFPGVGSIVPPGTVTVAVLAMLPLAAPDIVAGTV